MSIKPKNLDFEQLFGAHDIMREMGERIEEMYKTAAETGRKEEIAGTVAEMQKRIDALLAKRARFDLFCIWELDMLERKLLELRFERRMSWKEVAGAFDISRATVERIFNRILQKAEKYGGLFKEGAQE